MAKTKSRKEGSSSETRRVSVFGVEWQNKIHDAALISLFARSLGAVNHSARSLPRLGSHSMTASAVEAINSSSGAQGKENGILSKTVVEQMQTNSSDTEEHKVSILSNGTAKPSYQGRKRKRKDVEDDLESQYMSQLIREESKKDQSRARVLHKRHQEIDTQRSSNEDMEFFKGNRKAPSEADVVPGGQEGSAVVNIPQHESLAPSRDYLDLEKSSRTVFLANVSTIAIKSKEAKKELMNHLASFTSSLPAKDGGHGIESLRFRSTAFAATGIPKKAAFVRKEIMDATTKSTNAYVVYTSRLAAREAAKRLNGSIVLGRHLRVDLVAHPAKIDHQRCVFVGNLGFVDDETAVKDTEDEENSRRPRKAKNSADVEEGLWRQFKKAGIVESVRVVRDKTTRVGKGFAYIQFKDANSVEGALLYHEKKFPPMLPRILRVTRATKLKHSGNRKERPFLRNAKSTRYRPKITSQVQSLTGRARMLLGRAGAARATGERYASPSKSVSGAIESPVSVVFEGFRASRSQRKGALKTTGRKHSKPSNRSKEFKAKGKKKSKQ